MEVRPLLPDEITEAYKLLASSGWADRLGDLGQFQKLIAASQIAVVAIVDGRIVGFARALSDGISNGYLSMLVVDRAYRRRGIGRALVEFVIGDNRHITWVLRAGRDGAAEFFAKLGFEPSAIAMERRRI